MLVFRCSILFFFLLILFYNISAQYKEIFITSDNDAYLLDRHDGYYTNGLFLGMRYPSKRDSSSLFTLGIRQDVFTPGLRDFLDSSLVDRPYAGHLYAWLCKQKFYQPERFYYWKVQTGVIGRASFAEGVQTALHRWVGLGEIIGWEYQIPNMFSLALAGGWAQQFFIQKSKSFAFKAIAHGELSAGTTNVKAAAGAYLVVGRILPLSSSSLFGARSRARIKLSNEAFLFSYPSIIWQGYDATIQGSWLKPPSVGITRDLVPFLFQHVLGVGYAAQNVSIQIEIIYQSRSASTQLNSHAYGCIKLAYLLQSKKVN